MHAFPVPAVLACATSAWLPYLVWQPVSSNFQTCAALVRMYLEDLSLLSHAEFVTLDTSTTSKLNRTVQAYIESGLLSWAEELKLKLKVHFIAGLRNTPGKSQSLGGVGSVLSKDYRDDGKEGRQEDYLAVGL